ncbi:adenylate/guanylate cyclase domain-containing protein [Algoriphagus mannitolivorans]|uniref:adenylate/guanylate cyclase domain-containing protein n=1 Tax=Algoriphagus mannitolivorans TaxID=226504 RepID=UPI0004090F4A|nr:adenylate/guanylate cyclase domain-containing protein [Algoriphagus mannitolivorans]
MNPELVRKQATVFFSDIVGYTRLMGIDEDAAFQLMKDNLATHQRIFSNYGGQVVKELGDGILGVFDTPEDALNASLEIQKACMEYNKFQLRIGLHCGDIIFDHGDVFGDAVNQSSRIQSVGVPNSILVSGQLIQKLGKNNKFSTLAIGSFELKNVAHKVELHALTNPPLTIPKKAEILQNIKYQERNPWIRWGVAGAFLILISALIYSLFFQGTKWGQEKSIAVLPFENLSQDAGHEYFSEGLTGDIIYQLSEIDSIRVVPFEQVENFKGTELSLDSIGKIFDVTTVLKGSVDFIGSKVQVNVRLVDIANSKNIWSETYTRENTGIVSIQNTIAREIARALNANLSSQELFQIGKTQTTSPEAYDLYLKAKNYYFKYNREANPKAISYFKQAIKIDPNYALAYAGLADAFSQMPSYGLGMTWLDSSMEASDKALAIEPTLAEAYSSKGINYYYQGKNEYAKISFEKALAYKPNLSRTTGNLATIYFSQGELVKSLKLQAKSASLNPRAFLPYQISGWIYRILGDADNADYFLRKAIEIQENAINYEQLAYNLISIGKKKEAAALIPEILKDVEDSNTLAVAGLVAFHLEDLESAREYFEKSIAVTSDFENDPYYLVPVKLAYILKLNGNTVLANQYLDQGIELRHDAILEGDEDFNLPLDLAIAKIIKGEIREANKYLNLAFDRGWRDLFIIDYNPVFEEYRKSPEYARLSSKIKTEISKLNQTLEPTSLQRDK